MKPFLFILFAVISVMSMHGQGKHKVKLYDSWYFMNPAINKLSPDFHAYTYEVLDSSVTVVAIDRYMDGVNLGKEDLNEILVRDIKMIQFRRKGSKKIGVAVGLTGLAIGALIGLTFDTEPVYKPLVTISSAVIVGGICFAIGFPTSSIKMTYRIKGDIKSYREKRLEMIPYTIKYYTQ